jgi:arginyl-tRNA synthetase
MSLVDRARASIEAALARLNATGELGDPAVVRAATWSVERPKRPEHGDLATNVAMVLTKKVGKPPRVIAEAVANALTGTDFVASAEVAGPGFLNLRLHPRAFHAELGEILAAGTSYGHAAAASGERIDVEFVSANPTGPLLVAHGRGAVYGDAVARLLEASGNRVVREYYINDYGNQVRLFAESVLAVSEGREVAEDGYKGAYILELAAWLKKVDPAALAGDRQALARTCVTWMLRGIPGSNVLRGIKRTLADLRVFHDVWFSEESLHRWGAVDVALRQLQDDGYLVEKEGAVFFTSKDESDAPPTDGTKLTTDKDRVVRKTDGATTYFASDIAYQADKIARGYDRLVIVLGADHHGYTARIRNSMVALGLPSERFEALLYQLVFIYRDGELVKSSKRAGNIITVEEVTEEIDEAVGRKGAGADALRFFFLSRGATSNIDFDIELAKKKSLDNPVFYVQYGHARLCSILRKAREIGIEPRSRLADAEWVTLIHPDELAITARLSELPAVLAEAAAQREPHRLVFYVQELARTFQSYFTRLKDDPILPPASVRATDGWQARWNFEKTTARLAWIEAIRCVYAGTLALLGVDAPERMDKPAATNGEEESSDA